MQTKLDPRFAADTEAADAEAVLRACVHCGFCNATCPTYLELGDERDGPRGRIYLIKQLLESGTASRRTQLHLDRCLTCLACETTCPSGVEYGRLADIGRRLVEERVRRPWRERWLRWLLVRIVPDRRRFGLLLGFSQLGRRLAPPRLRARIPSPRLAEPLALERTTDLPAELRPTSEATPASPTGRDAAPERRTAGDAAGQPQRAMLALEGCAQAVATPQTHRATVDVLARLGIGIVPAPAGCCGALPYHLSDRAEALKLIRRNIDAWWPQIEAGAEAIVVSASGCGAVVKDYGRMLAGDADYADKARRVSVLAKDIAEIVAAEDLSPLRLARTSARIAVHCPCTLQHAQRLPATIEKLLGNAGISLAKTRDPHLCCGSAGAYSILQPGLGSSLRDKKLAALTVDAPDLIATANVGCQLHLQAATQLPVRHWIEVVDALASD
jgi:glycolate oxidase iron-sulfur subunit